MTIVNENWRLLAIYRFQDGLSNDKRVKVVRGYIYEVISGHQNREERGMKEDGAVGGEVTCHYPNTLYSSKIGASQPKNNK